MSEVFNMKKKAEERQKQILSAAYHAVAEKGYESVTLQDIADYAKVSKGVVHYYFENKEDVLSKLLASITEQIAKGHHEAIAKQTTAEGKLRAYIDSVFISPEKNKTFYRVYLDFIAKASQNDTYREINQTFYENCFTIARSIIVQGQEEGVFDESLNPESSAKMIRALIDGLLIQWLMRKEEKEHLYYKTLCLESALKQLT